MYWDVGEVTMGTLGTPWSCAMGRWGHWEHHYGDIGDIMKLCIGTLGTSPWGHHDAVHWDVGDITMGTLGTLWTDLCHGKVGTLGTL